jgi:enediyne biosynthesis protein E4
MFRQHFGLGAHQRIDSIEIRWPSGVTHAFHDVVANQILTLKENEPLYVSR